MFDFRIHHIYEMVDILEKEGTNMVIADYYNGIRKLNPFDIIYSGIRGIKAKLIEGIYNEQSPDFAMIRPFLNYDTSDKGYCLEKVLNLIARKYRKNGVPEYSKIELDLHLRKGWSGNFTKREINNGFDFFA